LSIDLEDEMGYAETILFALAGWLPKLGRAENKGEEKVVLFVGDERVDSRAGGEAGWSWEEDALARADALYRTALRMTKGPGDAEDLVQDSFAKAFRIGHTFRSGTNLRAWLFKILTNSYINQYRKSRLRY